MVCKNTEKRPKNLPFCGDSQSASRETSFTQPFFCSGMKTDIRKHIQRGKRKPPATEAVLVLQPHRHVVLSTLLKR